MKHTQTSRRMHRERDTHTHIAEHSALHAAGVHIIVCTIYDDRAAGSGFVRDWLYGLSLLKEIVAVTSLPSLLELVLAVSVIRLCEYEMMTNVVMRDHRLLPTFKDDYGFNLRAHHLTATLTCPGRLDARGAPCPRRKCGRLLGTSTRSGFQPVSVPKSLAAPRLRAWTSTCTQRTPSRQSRKLQFTAQTHRHRDRETQTETGTGTGTGSDTE